VRPPRPNSFAVVRATDGIQTFRKANFRDLGGRDFQDILDGVDLLIAKGIADPERMGLMGWSYGGFMA